MMAPMQHGNLRNVFVVVAGGNPAAERHFEDTIQRRRTVEEVRGFLPSQEIENLERIYHGSKFIVWGAVPGPMNESRWEKMKRSEPLMSNRECCPNKANWYTLNVRTSKLQHGLKTNRESLF
jgi:hypothetical protein